MAHKAQLQHRFPLLPPDAIAVSVHLALERRDGHVTFFNASGPIFTFREDDEDASRFAAVMLCDPNLGLAQLGEIAAVLGCHRSRIHEYRKRYRQGGTEALRAKRRGPHGPSKLKGDRLTHAQQLLDEGRSKRQVAQVVGVSEFIIRKAIIDGVLKGKPARVPAQAPPAEPPLINPSPVEPPPEVPASTPAQRSQEDASCAGGVAVKRVSDRVLASVGVLTEASPQFVPAQSVAKAGVLVALPALLGLGLVEESQKVYGALKNGYFGLTSMVVTFAFMALLRIKSIEELTDHAPGEFGAVLGLDRAAEMKTARRKLAELAARAQALEFSGAFTQRWATDQPDTLGYLYIDGHVRPYHGRTHTLPKTHVQQRRLCKPATTDYWVNDANAQPLLFVTAEANDGLLSMLDTQILPQVRKLAGPERRVTLIFDREGWSPKRFKAWHDEHFDVMTYRKGNYDDWQRRCFEEVAVEVSGRTVRYLLAERIVHIAKGFQMREVRRLCDDGHQTSVMTTRRDLTRENVAVRMFSRWQQENFFRYMRHEFALDHMPTTAVEQADPERTVPNPARKAKKRELTDAQRRLTDVEQSYGERAYDNPEQTRPTVRGFKISHAPLGAEIRQLRALCEQLKAELKALPARVPVRDTMHGEPIVRLERERKTIIDSIKMVAYRAETQLANLVGPLLPYRDDEARKFLGQVFALPADILPDYARNLLVLRLHSMANPRSNAALASLCGVLNDLAVCYPGTPLRLRFEAQGSR